MITPKWRWLRRGSQTHNPPRLEEIMRSAHPDVMRLAAVWKGPGWYPTPVLAQVESVGDDEYHVTFWPEDPGSRAMGDEPYVEHGSPPDHGALQEAGTLVINERFDPTHERAKIERDEWRHEAESNATKLVGEMRQRSMITELRHCIERLSAEVKREREGFTKRRHAKNAQWRELVAKRDAAQAEAAAMRTIHCDCATAVEAHAVGQHESCEYYQHHCDSCHQRRLCTAEGCEGFVLWQEGRDLAARQQLLEAVADAARALVTNTYVSWLAPLKAALDALDSPEPKL